MGNREGDMSYSGTQAAEIVGISYRQIDYWERTDLVKPSISSAHGSGTRREYSYRDLVELRMIRTMLSSGLSLSAVRTVMRTLRERPQFDLCRLTLVISEHDVRLCNDDEIVDVVRSGTSMVTMLPLGGVMDAVDAVLHSVDAVAVI